MLQRPSYQHFDSKMTASESALRFLKEIDLSDLEYFMYPDKLINFTDFSSEIGCYEVKVKNACYDLLPCIKVKIKNNVSLGDIFSTTKVVSFIGQRLKTLYQTFEETSKVTDFQITKKVIFRKVDQGYEITNETNDNGVEEHWTRFISKSLMSGFISVGASVILNRLLVSNGIPYHFAVVVFNQYWELTAASYKILDNLKLPFHNKKIDVSGIEKIVYSVDDYEIVWQMYFVPDGHLMTKVQVGSPISMKVKEQPEYVEKDTFLKKGTFEITELHWEDDMQLVSHFLDFKDANKSKCLKYLKDHPDIKKILKDFMQSILIRKPNDPINFASQYFVTFSSRANPNYICHNSKSISCDFLL